MKIWVRKGLANHMWLTGYILLYTPVIVLLFYFMKATICEWKKKVRFFNNFQVAADFSQNKNSKIFVQVGSQSAQMKMTRVPIHGGLSWLSFNEETTTTDDSSFTMTGLLEQLNTTRDLSDYLWYSTEWVTYNSALCFLFFLLQFFVRTIDESYYLIWFFHILYLSCSFC